MTKVVPFISVFFLTSLFTILYIENTSGCVRIFSLTSEKIMPIISSFQYPIGYCQFGSLIFGPFKIGLNPTQVAVNLRVSGSFAAANFISD